MAIINAPESPHSCRLSGCLSMQLSLQDLGDLLELIAPVDQLSIRPDQDVRRNEANRIAREDVVVGGDPTPEVGLSPR